MVDLSIVLPAIRPKYWKRLYESTLEACAKHSFEIIFITPYNLIDELKDKPEIKLVRSYSCPVRSIQLGAMYAEGRLMCVPTDDGEYFPNSFDASIDMWDSMKSEKALVCLRYREGQSMAGIVQPPAYWTFGYHPNISDLCVPHHFLATMQPLLSTKYYHYIGGIDCRFEHLAMGLMDVGCRVQFDGGPAALSPVEVMNADWLPGDSGDHGPVDEAQRLNDTPLFRDMYSALGKREIRIDFDNWKHAPSVWPRRWPNGVKT